MLNDFNQYPGKYEHRAQHRELKAALEYDAMIGADDWAHTQEHGHWPYANKVRIFISYPSNVHNLHYFKGACNHPETHNDDGSLITVEGKLDGQLSFRTTC